MKHFRWPFDKMQINVLAAVLGVFTPWLFAIGDEPSSAVNKLNFSRDVRPLLADRCFKCHGPSQAEAGLRLDRRDDAVDALNPSDPSDSELLRRIFSRDSDEVMPPAGKSSPLSDQDKETLRTWVESGANYEPHWAYEKPIRPAVPEGIKAIDYFIRKQLDAIGLASSPAAEPAVLLRRLSLDLIGLPPSEAELDAFLSDPSAQNYERQVDRLLASPHFGEKWARYWLDLARYADSNGYQHDGLRTMWPYRDWVIRALNGDMPYDQFTIEQLAGDLLPDPTIDQLIATGFHRNTPANLAGGSIREEVEVQMKMDRVNTTGLVWLASTLECAGCHDHKFDPITQRDYYKLYAYFNQMPPEVAINGMTGGKTLIGPEVEAPVDVARAQCYAELLARRAELQHALEEAKPLALADRESWEKRYIAEKRVNKIPWNKLPDFARKVRGLNLIEQPKELRNAKSEFKVLYVLFYDHPATAPFAQPLAEVEREIEAIRPPKVMVMRDLPQTQDTFIFQRGSYLSLGEKVDCGILDSLHPLSADAPRNRLGLAQWIVSTENPLTARVAVNRWWAELFASGIVSTLENFGLQSVAPSHPELLDWLAVELTENNWSMKHLLKTIVMSETYQQSSRATPELLEHDPSNRLLGRSPRVRLPAELIRDNALAISGLLSREQFGPPIYPPQPENLWKEIISVEDPEYPISTGQDRYRRGIYVVLRRGNINPSLLTFDATDRGLCVTKRSCSNTPFQALALLNDPVFVEAAQHFGDEIALWQGDVAHKARRAFRRAVGRFPSDPELRVLINLFEVHESWFDVTQVLLNFDETVTRS